MNKPPNNIFLVGPMGAGKSTVGRHLARSLGKDFVDCDHEIEARTGASISLIFELEGESGFRKRESAMLREITDRDGIVMATGGGAVLDESNRARLGARGYTIYLEAPLELLIERTSRDRNRPLLDTDDPAGRLREIMTARAPLYSEVADLTVRTNQRTARHVVKEILRRLGEI